MRLKLEDISLIALYVKFDSIDEVGHNRRQTGKIDVSAVAVIMNLFEKYKSAPSRNALDANCLEMVLRVLPFDNGVVFGMKK